jgi:PAS domain S-box-containing protein
MPHTALLQALPDAALFADPSGIILGWNDMATQLYGWTSAEMAGRPIEDRLPPSSDERLFLRRIAREGQWRGDFHDFRKDGSRVWTDTHVQAVRDASGEVTGLLVVSRPIDRQAITDERDRFAVDILNSMTAHVAVLGPDGRIRKVNRAWERFAEANTPDGTIPPSTTVGVDYVGLCRSASGEKADEAGPAAEGITDVLCGNRAFFAMEYPCDSPTESRWFAMYVTPLSNKEGGAVVAHQDITKRKQAELDVALQSRRTELTLRAAHMGVWTLDLASGRIAWSDEVKTIVGLTDFEGTLEAWTRLVHPEDLPEMQARFQQAIERKMPFSGEFRIVLPTGDVRWLSNVAQVECSSTGLALTVVGTVQDITGRKRSEWALTAYNQVLELIAAGAELPRVLDQVVRLVEEQLPGSLCSVLIVEKDTNRLRLGAGRSLPDEYNRAVDGIAIGPRAGSCGTAAFRGHPVTVTDIASDPLWDDFRELALRHGLRSCVSVPILSSGNVPGRERGEVIGTFALYNRTPGDFDRMTYAVLSGAEELVRIAVQSGQPGSSASTDSNHVIEAAHLAGVAIERDHAGSAIRESEERFRAVFDTASSSIVIRDLAGRLQFVNRATARLFRVSTTDWIGKQTSDVLPADLARICEANGEAALHAEQPIEQRISCRLPGDREATFFSTHVALRHADGAPYAICGILQDITELVAAQREFERVWLHAPEPMFVAGFDGSFKRLNPAWASLLGWTEPELLSKSLFDLVHSDDQAKTRAVVKDLIGGTTNLRFDNRIHCKDGTFRWLSWDTIALPTEETIYGFVRDVTEEKHLTEQVQHAQRMDAVGRLASGVAHDFNNLLTVINGYTELVLTSVKEADDREALAEVLHAGQRASELTSQLLAFSRKAILESRVVDINQVVESSARMLRRLIRENVKLVTHLTPVPPVKVDPVYFEQVFVNLAVNARDAMPQGGRLSIATEFVQLPKLPSADTPSGPHVQISVADTGVGMDAETLARIFEPFFTTKGPGKGTGLGLATVYGTVRQAGGAIEVESEPDAGTLFRIFLPIVEGPLTNPRMSGGDVTPSGSETVLVAEDEDGVRKIVKGILELHGFKVLVAESGSAAARIAAESSEEIDLLLTDVVLPDFGGRALADQVRARRPGIRVLYMSGYTDDAVIRAGVEAARDAFIQKPFSPLLLGRRVRDLLDGAPERPVDT